MSPVAPGGYHQGMDWSDVLRAAAAFALVLGGIALAYALVRAAAALRSAETLLTRLEADLPGLLQHGDRTLDRVDRELDQVDRILRTTADGVEGADRTVRRVGRIVEAPVGKVAGASAFVQGAVSGLRHRGERHGDDDGAPPAGGEGG